MGRKVKPWATTSVARAHAHAVAPRLGTAHTTPATAVQPCSGHPQLMLHCTGARSQRPPGPDAGTRRTSISGSMGSAQSRHCHRHAPPPATAIVRRLSGSSLAVHAAGSHRNCGCCCAAEGCVPWEMGWGPIKNTLSMDAFFSFELLTVFSFELLTVTPVFIV